MLLDNRYRILRTLGKGGFGETFLAEDTQMPSLRRCVIKQLKPIHNSSQIYKIVQERFQREAAILENLGGSSDQIPTLYAYFQANGQFYLVQEYIQGKTLTQIVQQRGIFRETDVQEILMSLLNILNYVHNKGIIHRDIKPDNIILRENDGKPVLIDFGAVRETMAAVVNEGDIISSIIIGTPGFISNEQAIGRPVFASDLYSLGLVAIYLLTKKLPKELDVDSYTGEINWQNNTVSTELAAVLDKAIRSDVKERFSTARAMLDALTPTIVMVLPTLITANQSVSLSLHKPPRLRDWIKPALMGGVIGVCVLAAFISIQTYLTKLLTTDVSFYYLADSAYREIINANTQVKNLKTAGYSQAGMFWIQNYPNLPTKPFHLVYVSKFSNRNSCIELLKIYIKFKPEAYCAFASKDASAPTDRISASKLAISSTPSARELAISSTPSQPLPEQAVRDYYAMINSRDYLIAWNNLSTQFQKTKADGSYSKYVDWWSQVERVEVEEITTLSTISNMAIVNAQLKYYMKKGNTVAYQQEIKLLWDGVKYNWIFFQDDMKIH